MRVLAGLKRRWKPPKKVRHRKPPSFLLADPAAASCYLLIKMRLKQQQLTCAVFLFLKSSCDFLSERQRLPRAAARLCHCVYVSVSGCAALWSRLPRLSGSRQPAFITLAVKSVSYQLVPASAAVINLPVYCL